MKALVRFGIATTAASLALAPAPVVAQDVVAPALPSEGAIGPAQLRDFNLNGTVIRRAEPAPEPAPVQERAPAASATPPSARAESAPQRSEPARQVADRETPSERPVARAAPEQSEAARSASLDLSAPSPADPLFSPAPVLPGSAESSASFAPADALAADEGGFSTMPWLLALLLLGGAAVYHFRRQRSLHALAGGPQVTEFAAPEPRPQPQQPQATPPAAAPAPGPVGIVSTRIPPELVLQFSPDRLAVEEERVTLEFEVAVVNSGNGPARDVLLEAVLLTAGPTQARELAHFFGQPAGQGERVPLVPPLRSMAFRSAVTLPRAQVRQFQAGERTVFVPVIGFNLHYRWSGGEGRASTSYLVGVNTRGDRLAPFRLDSSPRLFTGLAARELDSKVSQ